MTPRRNLRPAPVRVSVRPRLRPWEYLAYGFLAGLCVGMVALAVIVDLIEGMVR